MPLLETPPPSPPTTEALILGLGAILLSQAQGLLKAFINWLNSVAERVRSETKSLTVLTKELEDSNKRYGELEQRMEAAQRECKEQIDGMQTQLTEALSTIKNLRDTNLSQERLIEAQRLTIARLQFTGNVTLLKKEDYNES